MEELPEEAYYPEEYNKEELMKEINIEDLIAKIGQWLLSVLILVEIFRFKRSF